MHRPPRCLVLYRRMFRKKMAASMDVGVVPVVVLKDRINDHVRLLGRCCIVQVNQCPAAHSLPEDRKVTADLLHIELRNGVPHVRWTELSGQSLGSSGHAISSQFLPMSSRRFSVAAPGAELAIWKRHRLLNPSPCSRTGPPFLPPRHSPAQAK